MKKEEKEAEKLYNLTAEKYHDMRTKEHPQGWFYNEWLEMPATLELLGNVKGKKILDFGCGTGIYAKLLTKKGAKVKGFDISPKMVKIAKQENPGLDLRVGSAYKVPFNERFDIVLASLVVDYVKDWDKMFKEIRKVLKTQGIFIFSVGNPVNECRVRIKYKGRTFRILGKRSYFKEIKLYENWTVGGKKVKPFFYHKTYETIIKTILKNGFEILDYKDAFPKKGSEKYFPEDYDSCSKIPFFCVWKVRKKG